MAKSRKPRALDPHAELVEALILATGTPSRRTRRRLAAAQAAMSAAVTAALFGAGTPEPLVEVA